MADGRDPQQQEEIPDDDFDAVNADAMEEDTPDETPAASYDTEDEDLDDVVR